MEITEDKILAWKSAKEELAVAKETEMTLRKEICDVILVNRPKGATHFKKYGMDLTATGKFSTPKIEKDLLTDILSKLSKTERSCIRYKPELVAKNYKMLPEESILHQAVISKDGTPDLKLKIIKE